MPLSHPHSSLLGRAASTHACPQRTGRVLARRGSSESQTKMPKTDRARIILGQILSLDRSSGRTLPRNGDKSTPAMRLVEGAGRWSATITLTHAPASAPGEQPWDLLNVHADGALVLALSFRGDEMRIIRFVPGQWEIWFSTFDPFDPVAIGTD